MSYRRDSGRVVFECDATFHPTGCEREATTGEGDLRRAVAIVKTKGWRVRPPTYRSKVAGKWSHFCGRCEAARAC